MTLPILILPCWLYHSEQGAKLITTQRDLDAAEAAGWRDSPAAAKAVVEAVIEPTPDESQGHGAALLGAPRTHGVEAVLDASEAALADAEVVEALEAAEDLIIEKVQAAVSKKRKSKTS